MREPNVRCHFISIDVGLHGQSSQPVDNYAENLHDRDHIEKEEVDRHFELKIVDQIEVVEGLIGQHQGVITVDFAFRLQIFILIVFQLDFHRL